MDELYEKITESFKKEMINQLSANKRKGDRDGWLSCQPMQLVLEIYYHTGKLQQAVKDNNLELINEYSADVANLSMMVLDRCGGLLPHNDNYENVEISNTNWTNNILNKKP